MEQHRGELLEKVVRRGPYAIKTLAQKLGISRNTLYNRFKEHDLDYTFILQVGDLIHYDFKADLPEIKTTVAIQPNAYKQQVRQVEKNYIDLLERYNNLLQFVVKITSTYGLETFKQKIDQLTAKDSH